MIGLGNLTEQGDKMRWNEIVVIILSLLIYFYLDHFFHFVQHPWIVMSLLIVVPLYIIVELTIGIDKDWKKNPKITNVVTTLEIKWRLYLLQWLRFIIQDLLRLNVFPSEEQILNGLKDNDNWIIFSTKSMLDNKQTAYQMVMNWSSSIRFVGNEPKNDRDWLLSVISKKSEIFDDLPVKWKNDKQFIIDACKQNKNLLTILKMMKNQYVPSESE